jgi:hypothetical protein
MAEIVAWWAVPTLRFLEKGDFESESESPLCKGGRGDQPRAALPESIHLQAVIETREGLETKAKPRPKTIP